MTDDLRDYYASAKPSLPAYFTCPSCGGKKDYYSTICRKCKRLKPEQYKRYPERGGKALHLAIAEQALGHPLPIGAQVHHVNQCKGDARNSNLVICQDRAYHALLHQRTRIIRAGGDPNTQRICSYCKKLVAIDRMVQQGADHSRGPVGTACKACAAIKAKKYNAAWRRR